MLNLYKNKKFVKFSIPIGILGMLYLFFFLSQNLDTNNYKKPINKEFFSSLNKDFDNFFEIKKVNLLGRSKTDINLIENIVSSSLKNENNIIRNDFKKIKILLEDLKWIEKVSIKRSFPDNVTIQIQEHKAFAVFTNHKKSYLISDKGKIIYKISNPKAYNLIHLEGNQILKNLDNLKEFIYQNPELKHRIEKIVVKDNGRWNLVTKNGILFKLPLKDKQNAIDEINKYVSLNNIEIVDLRFLNKKIYVKTKQNEKIVMKKEGK